MGFDCTTSWPFFVFFSMQLSILLDDYRVKDIRTRIKSTEDPQHKA